jgi:hypothetical protein
VVLFERGSFDIASSGLTASALRLYAPAVLALALNELIGSSFHAHQDTLTPMRAGFLRVAGNASLRRPRPGARHRGLALATTLALYGSSPAPRHLAPARVHPGRGPPRPRRHGPRLPGRGGHVTTVVYPVAAFASVPSVLASSPSSPSRPCPSSA